MRPLVVVRSVKAVGGAEAVRCLEAFLRAEASSDRDAAGLLDMTRTNRERLSVVGADIIGKLEAVKAGILEEATWVKANAPAPSAAAAAAAAAAATAVAGGGGTDKSNSKSSKKRDRPEDNASAEKKKTKKEKRESKEG